MFLRSVFCIFSLLCGLDAVASAGSAAVEIPCGRTANLIWLEVKVAGDASGKRHFLLDSGAGRSLIDLRTARELGLQLQPTGPVLGVGRQLKAYRVQGFSATVAGQPLPENLLAVDLAAVSAQCGRRIDGLIGADFLKTRVVRIDYGRARVQFFPASENAAPGNVLKLYRRNDSVCVQAVVNGVPGLLRVDTGCSSALQWSAGAAQPGKAPVTAGVTGSHGSQMTASVQLGNEHFTGVRAGLHARRIFPGEDGLLGNGLLSAFVTTIDLPRQRLTLARP